MITTLNSKFFIFIFITVKIFILTSETLTANQLYVLPQHVNFETAVIKCKEKGMSLVRIDDAETNRIVQNFAGEKKLRHYWIDANDKNKENEFVHVDGSKVIYTNWNKTQPNNKNNNENCVSSGLGGYWFDINCDNKISSICYKILASENDEKFYTLPGQVNFETAVKMCKEKGRSLVRIDDAETNKIVLKYAMKNKLDLYWIDANDKKKENEFEHIDQTRVIYTNWDKNQPDNQGNNENCVVTGVLREGFWHDANCNKEKIGICNDDQFYVLPQLVNFETAVIKCKERGMSLVRIDDAETNRIVQNFAGEKKLHKYWIDANDKNKENEFVHVDGSKVIYTNWNKTQPNNKNNNENCVSSGLGGYWFDINCDNKISSICYKILASENDEKFYTLPGQVNFETAVKMCKEKGMSLVRIDDTETNKIVLKYAMKNKLDIYWIDANDQKKENEFEHIDQTRVIYTNWDKNQPDNLGKNENCVVTGVIREGFWHDANCNKEKIGICNDDQFYVLPQLVNFETAMIKCKERGMSLVRIDDSETNKIMHKYANEKNLNKHWIDASRNKEKEFVHIDGSKIIYVNWDRSEPSDTEGHKNCVYTGKKHEGFWHNFNCQNDIFGICNVTKVSSNDNQFYTITGLTNFETAVEICDEKGMSLVRIDNADTNKIVYDYAARKSLGRYWVDLNDRDKENLFVHSDGSKVNYINWSPNEPSNSDNKEHCVHSGVELKGLWNDINCDIPLVAICNTTKVPSNDRQFYVLPRQVNFETAVKMCEEKGMSLIRIDDSTTNKIVYEYAVGKRLSKHWIDANRNKRKEFVHIDGSKVIYTNWDKNEPSDAGGHKNCVYTSTEREGFWHDFNCQNDIFAICNVTKEKSQNANQFYVLPHLVNLKKAVKMCMEKGMSLVKIDDAVTNKILHKFALKKNLNIYWIDGYRKNKKNFVHLDNSDLTYTNWFFNEPNNFEGHENCIVGELNYGGFWNDFKCTQLIFGICNATTPTLKDNPSHILPKTFNHSSILRLCKEKGRKLVKLNHADLNDLSFLDILSLTKINLNSFKALVELVDYDENLFIFNQNDPHGPVNDKGDENISEVLRLNNDLLKYLKLDADVYVICYGDE